MLERHAASVQRLDADALADRILSISFVAALGDDERRRIARHARALAGPEPVELQHITELSIYARRG
jgi:hypothetical protein